jgi:indolepyruvate ferredoxin oxidoreductase alpha subunit
MEVQFTEQMEQLKLGEGGTFHGEGILAVTKALLQSGVAYVGGYQGAPVSHLLDVMVQARPYLDTLGVHVEACSNEASAAAMLGASIHYPLRGAVTWKSIVGTNVAADALSNLASPGVVGGALVVVGEDYGEGASVIQERTHAYALKSTMALFDPRPDLATMVRCVEHAFALSEASNMPALLELRIRACHVRGSFTTRANVAPRFGTHELIEEPARFDYMRLAHPPVTFRHEKLKIEQRIPAAQARSASSCRGGCTTRSCARCSSSAWLTRRARARCRCTCSTSPSRSCRPRSRPSAPGGARCWWSRKARPSTSRRTSCSRCAGSTCRRRCTARTCCLPRASTRWR